MPSTDIDGSVIVILSEAEGRRVYEYLNGPVPLDALERGLAVKLARALNLPPLQCGWNPTKRRSP
jgi:hypothetical protein